MAFTALQGGKTGIIQSYNGYNGIARQGGLQPERSDPWPGGLRGQLALCVISLWKFYIKKLLYYTYRLDLYPKLDFI